MVVRTPHGGEPTNFAGNPTSRHDGLASTSGAASTSWSSMSVPRNKSDRLLTRAALSHLELAVANLTEQASHGRVLPVDHPVLLMAATALGVLAHGTEVQINPQPLSSTEEPDTVSIVTESVAESLYHSFGPSQSQPQFDISIARGASLHTSQSDCKSLHSRIQAEFGGIQEASLHTIKSVSIGASAPGPSVIEYTPTIESTFGSHDSSPHEHKDELARLLMDAFDDLDTDKSGSIGLEELRAVFCQFGLPMAHCQWVFNGFDANNDGRIDRREWQAVIKRFRSIQEDREVDGMMLKLAENQKIHGRSLVMEDDARPRYVISFKSKRRVIWDTFMILLLIYLGLTLPLILAFGSDTTRTVDNVIDSFFVIDVILNFRTTYLDVHQVEIWRPRKIACHYLRTWFVLDFFSSIPIEQLSAGLIPGLQPIRLLKFGKIAKVGKIMRAAKVLRMLQTAEAFEGLEEMLWSPKVMMLSKSLKLLTEMLVCAHWLACLMIFVDNGSSVDDYFQDEGGASDIQRYLAAMYWSMMTMTTVGYGDIAMKTDLERLYAIVAMIVGGTFYGYIVGSMSSIVFNQDQEHRAFLERMDMVVSWLNSHQELPVPLRRRIWRHFKEFLTTRKAVSDSIILNDLPPSLSGDVAFNLLNDNIRYNALFEDLPPHALSALVAVLVQIKVQPGEVIVENGEKGEAMYIIEQGSLVKVDVDKELILSAGDSFGEETFLERESVYNYKVTTKSKVTMFRLNLPNFKEEFKGMPQALAKIKANYEAKMEEVGLKTSQSEPRGGRGSLLTGGKNGIAPSFPDAVMDTLQDLSSRPDHMKNQMVDHHKHVLDKLPQRKRTRHSSQAREAFVAAEPSIVDFFREIDLLPDDKEQISL